MTLQHGTEKDLELRTSRGYVPSFNLNTTGLHLILTRGKCSEDFSLS